MSKLTFVPVGGLANRMRAIASAVTLSEITRSELTIIWFQDYALNAPFYQLFKPIHKPSVCLKDVSLIDYLLLDRPRPKNFYFPKLYQKCHFQSCLYERSITPLCKDNFDFKAWIRENSTGYMASYTAFLPYSFNLINHLFSPVEEIKADIERHCQNFSKDTIGVHIRRTDNAASILQSPIELFYKKLDYDIEKHNQTDIYLATDSEEVKQAMKARYGKRVFSSEKQANRGTVEGIKDGITDMYTLARTQKIYGSFQSSFSEMASQIGGLPLEIITR